MVTKNQFLVSSLVSTHSSDPYDTPCPIRHPTFPSTAWATWREHSTLRVPLSVTRVPSAFLPTDLRPPSVLSSPTPMGPSAAPTQQPTANTGTVTSAFPTQPHNIYPTAVFGSHSSSFRAPKAPCTPLLQPSRSTQHYGYLYPHCVLS